MVALQQVILESTLRYVLNQSVLLIVVREKKASRKNVDIRLAFIIFHYNFIGL